MKFLIVLQALSPGSPKSPVLAFGVGNTQAYSKHLKAYVKDRFVGTWKAMNTNVKGVATRCRVEWKY